MRTIIKLTVFALVLFSFTACFPILMVHRDGGHGRWYYNNHEYHNRHEYREARRHTDVNVRIESRKGDDRGDRR